ncbi:MAG: hypothetical protein KAQ82_03675, partial [Dehalococcoidia bacterium]|nr:hypothetical protein [Dehalococcoidia bacterium]
MRDLRILVIFLLGPINCPYYCSVRFSPNLKNWTDITYVAAGEYHTVGLKFDGTVVAVGSTADGRCDVGSW